MSGSALDQRVLTLARHEAGDADHHGPIAEAVPSPDLLTSGGIGGREDRVVDARNQLSHPVGRTGSQGRGDPRPGVLAQEGDDVDAVADSAQRLPGAGHHGPTGLMAWVMATMCSAPAERNDGASNANGAAAPNNTRWPRSGAESSSPWTAPSAPAA